jgi:hypothetical protein
LVRQNKHPIFWIFLSLFLASCNLPVPGAVPGSLSDATATVQTAQQTLSSAATGTAVVLLTETSQAVVLTATPPANITPAPTQQVEFIPLQVTTGRIQEESQDPSAILDIEYPVFSSTDGYPVEGINQEVKSILNRQVDEFRKTIQEQEQIPELQAYPNSLYIRYEMRQNAEGLVSIYFPMSFYSQGAAHPLPFSETLTYDLKQNRRLELVDLFKPGTDYLSLLSQYSIEDLKRQDVLMWEEGAQPQPENFKSWNITPEGLVITFDPYQVTAYAMGYQKVILPWHALADVLIQELRPGE